MKEAFRVTLSVEPGDLRPAEVRLRGALKQLLRIFKLRCVRLERIETGREVPGRGERGKRG
jgi:hypothetical protein